MAKRVTFGGKPVKSVALAKHEALWGATSSPKGRKKSSGKKRGGKGGGS